jgi:hypothetical protein
MSSIALSSRLQQQSVLMARLFRRFRAAIGSSGSALNSESQSLLRQMRLLPIVITARTAQIAKRYKGHSPHHLRSKARDDFWLGEASPSRLVFPLLPTTVGNAVELYNTILHFGDSKHAPSIVRLIFLV